MGKKLEKVEIKDEYITLGQMLKKTNLISNGGAVKFFLNEHQILVNETPENRRGRKLRVGDQIKVDNEQEFVIAHADQGS